MGRPNVNLEPNNRPIAWACVRDVFMRYHDDFVYD